MEFFMLVDNVTLFGIVETKFLSNFIASKKYTNVG